MCSIEFVSRIQKVEGLLVDREEFVVMTRDVLVIELVMGVDWDLNYWSSFMMVLYYSCVKPKVGLFEMVGACSKTLLTKETIFVLLLNPGG